MNTIVEFEQICEEIQKQREECDKVKQESKRVNEKLDELEKKALAMLETNEISSYAGKVGRISMQVRETVRVPQDPESREQFFAWLKDRGLFESTITVHSQTINSLYRREAEAAVEAGNLMFSIPGLGEPTRQQILSFRQK